jgi:hypothetical protein
VWTIRSTWLLPTFKIIACRRMKPATHATRITPCVKAKLGGLKHIYVYYLGTPPAPENIKLYEPYNNRECLHCHAGARSFEEGAVHTADPDLIPALKANKTSCISSGCHEIVHDVGKLKDATFWKGGD